MKKSSELQAYCGLIVTFLLWGSLYVVSRVMLESLPVFVLAFVRFLIAWLFLLLISKLRKLPSAGAASDSCAETQRLTRRCSLILGIAGYAVFVGMQLIGTAYAGATTASLINALNPVSITLMAALILGERLTVPRVTGILLAIAGVYLIVGTTDGIHPLGVCFSVGSVLGWSFVSVLMRKDLGLCDPLIVTRNALGIAAACNFCFGVIQLAFSGGGSVFPPSSSTIAGVCYMGICSTGIAYILWNRSLTILPASTCSAFYPLQPLTSAVLGVIFLHETLPRLFVPGTLLILCGILICLFVPAGGIRGHHD